MTDTRSKVIHSGEPINEALTPGQFIGVLKRLRARIAAGGALESEDSDAIGAKHTETSWGVCAEDEEIYGTADLHIFPVSFIKDGRMAPRNMSKSMACPMDKGEAKPVFEDGSGCFYRCRIFQARRGALPTREEALALYTVKIAEMEEKFGKDLPENEELGEPEKGAMRFGRSRR